MHADLLVPARPHLAVVHVGPATPLAPLLARLQAAPFDFALCGVATPVPGAVFTHPGRGLRGPTLAQALRQHGAAIAGHGRIATFEATDRFDADAWGRLFAVADDLDLDLAQPAFEPGTPATHPIAWRHAPFQVRFTNAVDPAAVVFSADMLARVLPTLDGADDGVGPGRLWPRLTRPGRVAVVDATPVSVVVPARHDDGTGDAPVNFGGLLDSGDAICLSPRREHVDAMIEALAQACHAFGLGAADTARYLAPHVGADATAIPAALERELGVAGLLFNRVLSVPPAAAPLPAAAAPDAALAPRLALCEADLRDLRERHRAVVAERDAQAALLNRVTEQLTRAQRGLRERDATMPPRASEVRPS